MGATLPPKYERFNTLQNKQVTLVVQIEGVATLLSNRPIYTTARYGDPIFYGDPGLLYGGLRLVPGVEDILSLDGSSLTISQRIEPERGKGSISIMSLGFIDKNRFMSHLISPGGGVVDEILGKRVTVFAGFVELSYPEDYFQVFYGYISGVTSRAGLVTLQLSDPSWKKKSQLFYTSKTSLTAPIGVLDTTIPVGTNADFHKQILGPDGSYDPAVKTLIKIEDEYMQYSSTEPTTATQFVGVSRAAQGSTLATHAAGKSVSACVQIEDHAVDLALKTMLSGWGTYWTSSVPINAFVKTFDPILGDVANAIIFSVQTDVRKDYGLVVGDYVTVSGASNGANNVTLKTIKSIFDVGADGNRAIVLDDTTALVGEFPTSATLSFRSKYDVYPKSCGLKMTPQEVDVERHEYYKSVFLQQNDNSYRFLIEKETNGKTFIETEIYLPLGGYSVTKNGRTSMNLIRPPLPEESLTFIDADSILNPQDLAPARSTNTRKFYNEVDVSYDLATDGSYESVNRTVDADSISLIGITSVLPINSQGLRTDKGAETVVRRRAKQTLSRFRRGAVEMKVEANWEKAVQIECGDVIAVRDEGGLQLTNFETGERDVVVDLYEVQGRDLDFRSGKITLQLVAGILFELSDRYATISPSSVIDLVYSTSRFRITSSYGAKFGSQEYRKWTDYVGLPIRVHNYNETISEVTTFTSQDLIDPNIITVDPPLSFLPSAGQIIDIDFYPTSTDYEVEKTYKVIHAFLTPSVVITGGISNTSFTVGSGDIAKFQVDFPVRVHNYDYTIDSLELKVTSVFGLIVTVSQDMGFTPSAGQRADYLGYADGKGPYRFI